jgi:hypothetical protein
MLKSLLYTLGAKSSIDGGMMMVADEGCSKVSLLTEGYPRYGFNALSMLTRTGWDALCITRLHPEYVTKKYDLKGAKCLWLSTRKGKGTISPKSLAQIVRTVKTTLKKGGNRIIFLDGLEYILMWNELEKVISALRDIDDMIRDRNAEMLICIDPLTFEQREMDRLVSEFPSSSANEVVELLSNELPQQIDEALPENAGRRIGDLLGQGELHAAP